MCVLNQSADWAIQESLLTKIKLHKIILGLEICTDWFTKCTITTF